MINTKNFLKSLQHQKLAVFGLGQSGIATCKALAKSGARVLAWDDNEAARAKLDGIKSITLAPITGETIADCDALVLAPGVPLYYPEPHAVVKLARAQNVEILGDLEILGRCNPGRQTIGITGTNGKSTTTSLIHHILSTCGHKAAMGGNIGKAVLSLSTPPKDGSFVLEMSSFQIDLCPTFKPDIGVLLNITADHIDRHGNFENYVATKAQIFSGHGTSIIGIDDQWCSQILARLRRETESTIIPISSSRNAEGGVYVLDGVLYDDIDGQAIDYGSIRNISTLHGIHNHQNAAAAFAVARQVGIAAQDIIAAMKTYPGLAHRQLTARIINGIAYINDSKATNAEAAGKALACHKNIYWIVGGQAKEGGLNGLELYADRIRHAYIIGETPDVFAQWLDNYGIINSYKKTMEEAVLAAHQKAQAERGRPGGAGVVLLSPASASFDQYKSFEERGDHFIKLVKTLPESGL